jgi:hypothetical protein
LFVEQRVDLREEFNMADEAFALSPISARAVQPSEEDYAAISEAFMETSRGRWFLTEYAKRNRNADTRMVLDAVARIEASLAAQREESLAVQNQAAADAAETSLTEALAAIRGAVEAAQASAVEALDGLALEQKLAPLRKGARVIREISWRLREIGNDGRICDLIDSQVSVIENGAGQISSDEAKAALTAAFASIAERLAEFSGAEEAPAPVAEASAASASPGPQHVAPAALAEEAQVASEVFEAPIATAAPASEATSAERHLTEAADEAATTSHAAPASFAAAEAALAEAEAADEARLTDEAAADAHDEAVLDIIAMEMGAPEPFEIDDTTAMIVEEAHIAAQAPAEPETMASEPEPIAGPVEPPMLETPTQAAIETLPEPSMEMSLGSTIIASGLVRKPNAAANDPLAPIRRMSQAEKIAFFS